MKFSNPIRSLLKEKSYTPISALLCKLEVASSARLEIAFNPCKKYYDLEKKKTVRNEEQEGGKFLDHCGLR